MNPVALVNVSPSPQSTAMTYIGSGEMSSYNDERTCSLCGIRIRNFRIIKPIVRFDQSRPYFHRTGRNRGMSSEQRIGWCCGKHHVIDQNWLGNSHTSPLDNVLVPTHTSHMAESGREELREIRDNLHLGREKFAQALGYSHTAIFKYENGERKVPEKLLIAARMLLMTRKETAA